jgi:hypothetical protein
MFPPFLAVPFLIQWVVFVVLPIFSIDKVIKWFAKSRDKIIDTILEVYEDSYTREELETMYVEDRNEFNRIFKLASDEFFRRLVNEQKNPKKAQQAIKMLHQKIEKMEQIIALLEKNLDKNQNIIDELKNDINIYEEIFNKYNRILR